MTDPDAPSTDEQARTVVHGRICLGLGEGKVFTQLPWAKKQFIEKLGIDPYPGTLNLSLESPEVIALVQSLRTTCVAAGVEIVPDCTEFCSGRCFHVALSVAGMDDDDELRGAVVFPEVCSYPADKLEIIASVNVKQSLRVADGDILSVTFVGQPAILS